jgi:hypothetical protein
MTSRTFSYAPAFVLQSLLVCFYLLLRFACTVVLRRMVPVTFGLTVFRFSYKTSN